MSSYYDTLGIDKNATPEQIKKAYRKLSMKYHPDVKTTGDEAQFKKVQEAYDVLSDEKKKKMYDTYGTANEQDIPRGGSSGFYRKTFSDFDFNDIFTRFGFNFGPGGYTRTSSFGNQQGFSRPVRGSDINIKVNINLDAVFNGHEMEIKIERLERSSRTERKKASRVIKFKVPPGVHDGQKFTLRNEGNQGLFGGPDGNIHIIVNIKESPFFRRKGDNVIRSVEIDFTQAILGDVIDVKNINGENIRVNIPSGTNYGTYIRTKGKGFPVLNSTSRGDFIVEIKVKMPNNIHDKLKDELIEYQKNHEIKRVYDY